MAFGAAATLQRAGRNLQRAVHHEVVCDERSVYVPSTVVYTDSAAAAHSGGCPCESARMRNDAAPFRYPEEERAYGAVG